MMSHARNLPSFSPDWFVYESHAVQSTAQRQALEYPVHFRSVERLSAGMEISILAY